MNVDRGDAGNRHHGKARVAYCLDRIEEANGFEGDIDWSTRIAPALTVEELVGALVAAEIDLELYQGYDPLIADFHSGRV